jgi:glycosyltransferase involved in cell wall biosynthesis
MVGLGFSFDQTGENLYFIDDKRVNILDETSDVQPMVSVTMITYNHGEFIEQAIDGVLMQQTNFKIELIVGEDCSSDNTREILFQLQKKHPDKIILKLPESNLGIGVNSISNKLLCKGKYIAECEGDDYWTDPLKLQKQVNFLESNQNYVLHYHNCIEIINKLEVQKYWSKRHMSDFSFNFRDSLKEKMGYNLSMMFRSDYISNEFLALFHKAYYLDWSLELYLLNSGLLGFYTIESMGAYRHHDGGFTKINPPSELNFIDSKIRMLKSMNNSNFFKKDIASELFWLKKKKLKIFLSNFFQTFKNKFWKIKNLTIIK